MKTAKPLPVDPSINRRAQPVRQTRNNPPRAFASASRAFGGRDVGAAGRGESVEPDHPEIFPAITHFTDAITALPKELVRHFTLLKEVDAKIFAPEEALGQLVDQVLALPVPETRLSTEASTNNGPTSAPFSAPDSANGSIANGQAGSVNSTVDGIPPYNPANKAWDPENLPRRQMFHKCAITMQDMLTSLDEKNHVISTAADALSKQLSRLDECFPYIELEISEEARLGNPNHWAYIDNRTPRSGEKSRRDGASAILSAAHQASVDEAAARSEARKLALLAKKGNRGHHTGSDFEDTHKDGKKVHGNTKGRRGADGPSVGLGITNGANGNPPQKRRKVEKPANGGTGMERSLSSIQGSSAGGAKGKIASPRETPVPEGLKKRGRAAPAVPGPSRKRSVAPESMLNMAANPGVTEITQSILLYNPHLSRPHRYTVPLPMRSLHAARPPRPHDHSHTAADRTLHNLSLMGLASAPLQRLRTATTTTG
jgi:hypothetical protein